MARGSVGGGRREAAVLHDRAMADAVLLNRVSGGFHYMVLASEEEEGGARGSSTKEQVSNDDDEDDNNGLGVARA